MARDVITRRVVDAQDGWAVEERLIESGDGDDANPRGSSRSYYYREQLALRHELESKIAKRVAGLTLIEKDIRTMSGWVGALREALIELGASEDVTVASLMPADPTLAPTILFARALFVAVLTTYGKLFVTAEGRSTTVPNRWVGDQHKASHDYLMHMRHSFAAHGGEGAESCTTVVAIDYSQSHRAAPRVFTELFQPTFVGLPEVRDIELLLSDLQVQADAALNKATAALYDEIRAAFTPERSSSFFGWALPERGLSASDRRTPTPLAPRAVGSRNDERCDWARRQELRHR